MSDIGRNAPCPCGSGKKYKQCCMLRNDARAASALQPSASTDAIMQTAMRYHQTGRLAQADALYRRVLAEAPRNADALHLLGMIAHQTGRNDDAAALVRQAIDANPSFLMHFNLGVVLQTQGKLVDAVACYDKVIALKPDFPDAHLHLGVMHKLLGKLDLAEKHYRNALALKPDFPEAHSNFGNLCYLQGRLESAIECYGKALALRPNYADALVNLGNALFAQGEKDSAVDTYRRALASNPGYHEAYLGLASVFLSKGDASGALQAGLSALRINETDEAKTLLGRCIAGIDPIPDEVDFRRLLTRALTEPWARPGQFATTAVELIQRDAEVGRWIERANDAWPERLTEQALFGASGVGAIADNELLLRLLENTPVSNIAVERLLTMIRHQLLLSVADSPDVLALDAGLLNFHCALARQCFINEYIYDITAEEFDRAQSLRGRLAEALEQEASGRGSIASISPARVVAVAAYFPIGTIPRAERLLERVWPPPMLALLSQQVSEPLAETRYRSQIRKLTSIDDETSRRVRDQYEDHPYPRWVKTPRRGHAITVDGFLMREFDRRPPELAMASENVEILVAGCGTGRHPIQTAQMFVGAKVLAVDLSLASLGYARRKTDELGLENIEYAQADILQLGSLERTFDIIESHGVLHHLADPMQGWRVLHSLLRPGGFMNIGLYSEVARRDVVAARNTIAQQGFGADVGGIRRCRQLLLSQEPFATSRLVSSEDFYSTSSCRDLLFHVMEHRFTIPRIRACLNELDLEFVGFIVDARVVKRYREQFPDDPSRTNLECWERFENGFPDTFAGMYQFWARKPNG